MDTKEAAPELEQALQAFRARLEKELRGRLPGETPSGVATDSIYTQSTHPVEASLGHLTCAPLVGDSDRSSRQGWRVHQHYRHPDLEVVAGELKEDLAAGVDAIWLELGIDHGVRVLSRGDLDRLLLEVDLDKTPVAFEAEMDDFVVAAAVASVVQDRGVALASLTGSWGCDPLGAWARTGTFPSGATGAWASLRRIAAWSAQETPAMRALHVSTVPYHEGGASSVHELGWALATGLAYLRELIEAGFDPSSASEQILFVFAVEDDIFEEVAKLRAARLLWAKLLHAFGVHDRPMRIHARTSGRSNTQIDPWVNILRATTQTFAAVIGGANSIGVDGFDASVGPSDSMGRRIARNTQLVLREESHLHEVLDPAGGSWYVEHLTDALARRAWEEMQQIERVGGMESALRKGIPQASVRASALKLRTLVARRARALIGVTDFPNLTEKKLIRPEPKLRDVEGQLGRESADVDAQRRFDSLRSFASSLASDLGVPESETDPALPMRTAALATHEGVDLLALLNLMRDGQPSLHIEPIPPLRLAQPWERLRNLSNRRLVTHGRRPKAFLVTLGVPLEHQKLTMWVQNLLQAAGFEFALHEAHGTPFQVPSDGELQAECGLMIDAFRGSEADIAVLSASEEWLAEIGSVFAKALRTEGAARVLCAGRHPNSWDGSGVHVFLHDSMNLLGLFSMLFREIGGH
ncbi:MAG: methylmalonyl-CoA mutase family protein [Myxococcota bacterium]